MSFVVSFEEYTPSARYPPITTPWTKVRIEESSSEDGPWTAIETITFSDPDSNPARPKSRSFSTVNATLASGWYQVVFLDADNKEDFANPVQHAPDTPVGSAVMALIPLTWRALSSVGYYGTGLLMDRIAVAKHEIFPTVIAEASESTYTPLMIEYAAKRAALEIIPAGIEYWMNQTNTISATGTNEVTSYTDRANQLRELAKWLQAEVARLAGLPGLVASLLPPGDQPEVADNTEDYVLTESPYDFPPAFGRPTGSSSIFGSNE